MQNVRQSLGRLSARSRREEPSGSAVWASSSASFGVSAVASFSARLPGWYQTVFLTRPYSGLERPHYFLWSRNPRKSSWRRYITLSAAVSVPLCVTCIGQSATSQMAEALTTSIPSGVVIFQTRRAQLIKEFSPLPCSRCFSLYAGQTGAGPNTWGAPVPS